MVGRGKYRERQGQGLPLLPGKTLRGRSKWIPDSGPRSPLPKPAVLSAGLGPGTELAGNGRLGF